MPTLTEKISKTTVYLSYNLSSYFSDYKTTSERNWIFCEKENFLVAMGGMMSYFRGLFGSREMRILILGLDGAGKTTLLYRLQVSCFIILHVWLFSESWFSEQDCAINDKNYKMTVWKLWNDCHNNASRLLFDYSKLSIIRPGRSRLLEFEIMIELVF